MISQDGMQKDQTIQLVKDWVRLDNELRALQIEVSKRKREKAEFSDKLMKIMKDTDTGCYELKSGTLMYSVKNVKKPITKKVLLDVLQKYYEGDCIKASELNDYIMVNREETIKEKLIHRVGKESS
jgi:seryl-tRNA synthetase